MNTKECRRCQVTKSLDEFYLRKRKDGTRVPGTYCKACCKAEFSDSYQKNREKRKAQGAAWRAANREKWNAYSAENRVTHLRQRQSSRLRKLYTITIEDYEVMLESQDGMCAICKGHERTGTLFSVDHDHSTGVIRGLLCRSCNSGIGFFKDDIVRVQAAVDYLRSGGTVTTRTMTIPPGKR